MGVRLLFDRFGDIQGRIDIGDVRQAGDTSGYDDSAAVVPQGNWAALSEERPNDSGPTPIRRSA
ncbi:hypothetical protein [Streptosporangium sp. NPDC004631]